MARQTKEQREAIAKFNKIWDARMKRVCAQADREADIAQFLAELDERSSPTVENINDAYDGLAAERDRVTRAPF